MELVTDTAFRDNSVCPASRSTSPCPAPQETDLTQAGGQRVPGGERGQGASTRPLLGHSSVGGTAPVLGSPLLSGGPYSMPPDLLPLHPPCGHYLWVIIIPYWVLNPSPHFSKKSFHESPKMIQKRPASAQKDVPHHSSFEKCKPKPVRRHLTPTRDGHHPTPPTPRHKKGWEGRGETGRLVPWWGEYKMVQPLWKTVWKFLGKKKEEEQNGHMTQQSHFRVHVQKPAGRASKRRWYAHVHDKRYSQ